MNNFEEFDWEKYIDYYDDLRNILKTKENAINHWISVGCIQNRYFFKLENTNLNQDVDNNDENLTIKMFDWEKYLDINIDLQNIIMTKEQAYHHWKECGRKEGRLFCSIEKPNDFDWNVYISLNNDLKDIIKNEEDAIIHWNTYGKCENRLYIVKKIEIEIDESFDNFDWDKYIQVNKDLRNIITNKDKAYHHWKECGKKEGRVFFEIEKPKDFDWLVYVYLNNDLKEEINTEEKAIYHWNNFGKKEERKYCFNEEDFKKVEKLFDWEKYTTFYEDLNVLINKEIAYSHYITLGYKEGRKFFFKQYDIYENIKYEFDWKKYIQFYDDLEIDNKKDAIDHFLKLGVNENRTYFLYEIQDINDFDWEKYLYHYEDLKHIDVNEDNAISHWLNYGKKEGRIFFRLDDIDDEKDDTNVFKYYKKDDDDDDDKHNKDLEESVSIIKKSISNLSNKYIDFNWNKYLSFYNDISISENKTKEDAIKHWETIGSKDDRIYFRINDFSNETNNIDYVLNKIYIFAVDDLIDKTYSKIDYFKTKFYNDDEDKIMNNIELLKKFNLNEFDNILIINNKNISFDYLKYFKISLKKLFESNDQGYDLVQLSLINNKTDFYKNLDKNIDISEYAKNNYDCFYITSYGINKLLNKNFNILEDWNIGYYSRPLFGYTNKNYKELNNLWSSYYYVVNYWDKIYCINSGYDINKYKNMNQYCNLLNSNTDIIYNQLSDMILPDIDELIDLNIFDETFKNRIIKEDEICTSLTHCNIFRESFQQNYNNILIINDNIHLKNDYFNILYKIFNKYLNIDILYIGVNKNEDYNEKDIFNYIDNITIENDSYDIYKMDNNNLKLCNFIGLSLSNKALRILNEKSYRLKVNTYELINDLAFNQYNNYNLNCLYVEKNIFNYSNIVNNDITNIKKNKNINYLTKIKKINYKIQQNYKFKISIMNSVQNNYIDILKLILKKFRNYTIVKDNSYDIIIYTFNDNIELKNSSLNICINYKNNLSKTELNESTELTESTEIKLSKDQLEKSDIHITGSKQEFDNFNIYYPYIFLNLFNRKNNGKNYIFNKKIADNNVFYNKTNFCAYLENNDFISVINTYKISDLLDDMFYDEKYCDLLIEKYREYKFIVCNDNDDNISEKIINAIIANCIPIYFGSSDIFNYINKKRFVYSRDFTNYNDLLNYIIKLDNDMNLYSSVLEECVFIGNINYDNLEEYLEDKIDKSFGFKSKNILLNNNYINNKQSECIDLKIKKLKLDSGVDNNKLIKRYLNNFIREDDVIL